MKITNERIAAMADRLDDVQSAMGGHTGGLAAAMLRDLMAERETARADTDRLVRAAEALLWATDNLDDIGPAVNLLGEALRIVERRIA